MADTPVKAEYELGVKCKCYIGGLVTDVPAMPGTTNPFNVTDLSMAIAIDKSDATDRGSAIVGIGGGKEAIFKSEIPTAAGMTISGEMLSKPGNPQVEELQVWAVTAQVFTVAFMNSIGDGWLLPVFIESFDSTQPTIDVCKISFSMSKGYAIWGARKISKNAIVEG